MQLNTMDLHSHNARTKTHDLKRFSHPSIFTSRHSGIRYEYQPSSRLVFAAKSERRNSSITACIGGSTPNNSNVGLVERDEEEEEKVVEVLGVNTKREELAEQTIWKQMKETVKFSGPATGLWISGPLMSLISTAIIGRGRSTELAALGPGTVFCDNTNRLFMFFSIATSNMVCHCARQKEF